MISPEEIRYESIKEGRKGYYVNYSPPFLDFPFSMLDLTIEENFDLGEIASAMESEAQEWMSRYPLPVMVTAFSLDENRIKLGEIRPCDHLMAWPKEKGEIEMTWRLVGNEELPTTAMDKAFVHQLLAEVPHKTGVEIRESALRHAKQLKRGWWLVFFWAVVVPLAVAVVEWGSDLLGLIVLAFAFVKAGVKALRLMGKLPKPESEKAKEALDLAMRHYHYHCEKNPAGFARLVAENVRDEAVQRSKLEAQQVRKA